ncbi:MAG: hypothetical protein N2169_06950, partial [bacterium]|nr:hypothetical protein [bacterium]
MIIYLRIVFIVSIFVCILLFYVGAQDRVHTAVSTDGSPFFPDTGSWTPGNSFTNNSTISNSYSLGVLNPWLWDHNFAVYVYDFSSSSFVNNGIVINQANFTSPSGLNNFLNVGVWIGYNWVLGSQNSSITNNGNFTNTLNLSNQNQGNFFNYSLYSSYSNPIMVNNGDINNIINVSNCNNIQNLYNFSMASYESQSNDIFQNFGTLNNIINVNNSHINFGVFNYSINSFSNINNSLNV